MLWGFWFSSVASYMKMCSPCRMELRGHMRHDGVLCVALETRAHSCPVGRQNTTATHRTAPNQIRTLPVYRHLYGVPSGVKLLFFPTLLTDVFNSIKKLFDRPYFYYPSLLRDGLRLAVGREFQFVELNVSRTTMDCGIGPTWPFRVF